MTDALVGTTWVPPGLDPSGPWALAGGRWHWGTPEVSDDPAVLDGTGTWVVCLPAQGPMVGARFPHSAPAISPPSPDAPPFPAADPSVAWVTSLGRRAHALRVADIRERIADGDVYQVNLTRRLAGPVRQDHPGASALALTSRLAQAHQAPHGATLCLPALGVWVVGASPERFLRREGDLVISEPIKGTAASADLLTAKDRAENVMICDLVRNDLGRVCRPGTVEVPDLLRVEAHPSLVHLVTTVIGRLRPDVSWGELLDATFPPGSVTGAPKLAALKAIDQLEPTGRGPYCGARVGGCRCLRGRPGGQHPNLLGLIGRCDQRDNRRDKNVALDLRHRRRHHLGLERCRRMGRDRAEGRTPDRVGPAAPHPDRPSAPPRRHRTSNLVTAKPCVDW